MDNCCVDNFYSVCPDNSFNTTKCPSLMAQKCARNWDSKCDIYILQQGVNGDEFIRDVASKKYCREDKVCVKECDDKGCSLTENEDYSNKVFKAAKNFSSLKENEVSPLSVKKCDKVCDILNLTNFGDDDRVLNECLDRGSCQDIIMDLSENLVKNNISITNRRLKKFIDGYISKDVTNYQTHFLVGGKGPQITTKHITTPGPSIILPVDTKLKPNAPSGFIKSREDFNSIERSTFSLSNILMVGLLAFIVYRFYLKK